MTFVDDIDSVPFDPRLIDRMVDGELSEPEQRELLRRLEEEPHGWRMLALAYVEAHVWGHDFRQVLSNPAAAAPEAAGLAATALCMKAPAGSPRGGLSRTWLMLAACCLGAVLGTAFTIRHFQNDRFQNPSPRTQSAEIAGTNPAASPGRSTAAVNPRDVPVRPVSQGPTIRVQLDRTGDGDDTEVELPLLNASEVNPDWLHSQSEAIPPEVRRALEEAGHRVRQTRRLIPFQLDDGRWGVVPVDEVHFVDDKEFH